MKSVYEIALELQALQLLEDGDSLNGLHYKAIRRSLVAQLVEASRPKQPAAPQSVQRQEDKKADEAREPRALDVTFNINAADETIDRVDLTITFDQTGQQRRFERLVGESSLELLKRCRRHLVDIGGEATGQMFDEAVEDAESAIDKNKIAAAQSNRPWFILRR